MKTTRELAHQAVAAVSASPGLDPMTALDEVAGVVHDAECAGGYCRRRRDCWAWNAGRYHRVARTWITADDDYEGMEAA